MIDICADRLADDENVYRDDIKLIKCESNTIILEKCQEPSTKVKDVVRVLEHPKIARGKGNFHVLGD